MKPLRVPAAPLAIEMRKAAAYLEAQEGERRRYGGTGQVVRGGLAELARRYAVRYGTTEDAAKRLVQRIVVAAVWDDEEQAYRIDEGVELAEDRADRMVTLLGLHPDFVWRPDDLGDALAGLIEIEEEDMEEAVLSVPEGYVTSAEAAQVLGVSSRTVRRWVGAGRFGDVVRQVTVGHGRVLIAAAALEAVAGEEAERVGAAG